MRTSEQTDIIDTQMAIGQGELQNPVNAAKNSHFGNSYTTLGDGLNVVRPVLSKAGISVTQATRVEGDILMLDTRLSCKGQWIEAEYPVCRFPAKPQDLGSALTYARRYSLFSLVGIAGEDDDDGNEANKTPTPAPKREAKKAEEPAKPDYSEERDLFISALKMAKTKADLDKWGVDNAEGINRMQKADSDAVRAAFKAHSETLQSKKEAA
jgi:hypothetical protein